MGFLGVYHRVVDVVERTSGDHLHFGQTHSGLPGLWFFINKMSLEGEKIAALLLAKHAEAVATARRSPISFLHFTFLYSPHIEKKFKAAFGTSKSQKRGSMRYEVRFSFSF